MCLAIPMQIVELTPEAGGVCDAGGSRLPVNLMFISEPRVGDYVLIHAGYAIERIDTVQAEAQLAEWNALTLAMEGRAPAPEGEGGASPPP
jgi:hydrogenase expression/formation protein HypC